MLGEQLSRKKNYQQFTDRRLLKDLPFYRRYPRTFAIVGSTFGFLVLFSKAIYDICIPSNSTDKINKTLYAEKLKQLQLQEQLE